MSKDFFVSFNSPQCGWMSIGLTGGGAEFHTTTAHAPHAQALQQLLEILTALLNQDSGQNEFVLRWNRNPEEFDFEFRRGNGRGVTIEIYQYPTGNRDLSERERVFAYEGDVRQVCAAFYETFAHLDADKNTDEFEQNWRQPFPQLEFERFRRRLEELAV